MAKTTCFFLSHHGNPQLCSARAHRPARARTSAAGSSERQAAAERVPAPRSIFGRSGAGRDAGPTPGRARDECPNKDSGAPAGRYLQQTPSFATKPAAGSSSSERAARRHGRPSSPIPAPAAPASHRIASVPASGASQRRHRTATEVPHRAAPRLQGESGHFSLKKNKSEFAVGFFCMFVLQGFACFRARQRARPRRSGAARNPLRPRPLPAGAAPARRGGAPARYSHVPRPAGQVPGHGGQRQPAAAQQLRAAGAAGGAAGGGRAPQQHQQQQRRRRRSAARP